MAERGKLIHVHQVCCAECGHVNTSPPSLKQRWYEEELREQGWSKTARRGWICPRCKNEALRRSTKWNTSAAPVP